jgi:hypothetical protein
MTALPPTGSQPCDVTQAPAAPTNTSQGMLCTGSGACVAQPGDLACPTNAKNKHVVYVESAIKDTRVCAGCACSTGTVTCTAPTISVYASTGCQGTPLGTGAVTGSCVMIAQSINGASHFEYTSKPQAACTTTKPPAVTSGTFDPGSAITVCCP